MNTQLDNILHKFLNYDTIDASTIKLNLQSNVTVVDTSCQAIINIFQYETIIGTDMQLLTKSNTEDTYTHTDINVALSIVQAGIYRKVWVHVVDIDGKFKRNGVSNDI